LASVEGNPVNETFNQLLVTNFNLRLNEADLRANKTGSRAIKVVHMIMNYKTW